MFPYQRTPRPSSLPLPQNRIRSTSTTNDDQQQQSTVGSEATEEVQQFVGNLVNDAMKTINEAEGNATASQVDETTDESGVHTKSNSTLLDSKSDTFSIDDTDQQEPNNE